MKNQVQKEVDDEADEVSVQLSFYRKLNEKLETQVSKQFFQDPRHFKSIHEVIDAIGQPPQRQKDKLLQQQQAVMEVIEDVVQLQHGDLNRPVEDMSNVIDSYRETQHLIKGLRSSLMDARIVMSPTKQGQSTIRELWERKRYQEHQLHILDEYEHLLDADVKVQRLISQKKYLNAANTLNEAIQSMFGEDLVGINSLREVQDSLMSQKAGMLETLVDAFKGVMSTEFNEDDKYENMPSKWSLNLVEVRKRADLESFDPRRVSTSTYVRLLVCAAVSLGCAADIKVMLLDDDTLSEHFHAAVQKRLQDQIEKNNDEHSFRSIMSKILLASRVFLEKMLYIICLFSRNDNCNEISNDNVQAFCGNKEKKSMIALWAKIEDIIIDVMNTHFIEADMQSISYSKSSSSSSSSSSLRIGTPSVKLAADIYEDISGFSETIVNIFHTKVDENLDTKQITKVFIREQQVIEDELIPVIASMVNKEIRAMQSNSSKYFCPIKSSSSSSSFSSSVLDLDGIFGYKKLRRDMLSSSRDRNVCLAARIAIEAIDSLFTYWINLSKHREFFVTIIDRLILGFVSSAFAELQNMSFDMMTRNETYLTFLMGVVKNDDFYKQYKHIMHGYNDKDEAIMSEIFGDEATQMNRKQEECTRLGDMISSSDAEIDSVPINTTNFLSIVVIGYGCDWLLGRLIFRYRDLSSHCNSVQEVEFLEETLKKGFLELNRVSEKCAAMIRGELQIAYLRCTKDLELLEMSSMSSSPSILSLSLSPSSKAASTNQQPNPEALITIWNQKYVISYQDTLLQASNNALLIATFAPMCYVAPRLLLNRIKKVFAACREKIGSTEGHEIRSKLLRAIVACQQGLSMVFETASSVSHLGLNGNAECDEDFIQYSRSNKDHIIIMNNRGKLQDLLTDEFSRLKRYVQMFQSSTREELYSFCVNNDHDNQQQRDINEVISGDSGNGFDKDEIFALYLHCNDETESIKRNSEAVHTKFEGFWQQIQLASKGV